MAKATAAQIKAAYLLLASVAPFAPGDVVTCNTEPGDLNLPGSKETNFALYFGDNYTILAAMDADGCYLVRDEDGENVRVPFQYFSLYAKGNGVVPVILTMNGDNEEVTFDTVGKKIDVGCQTITFEEVEIVYKRMVELRTKAAAKKPVAKAAAKK